MTTVTPQQVEAAINTSIDDDIPDEVVSNILQKAPFITISGVFNARDISAGSSSGIMTGIMFRSGTLENITPDGIDALHTLGIKTVFDLRSLQERTEHPTPELPGIEIVWHDSDGDDAEATQQLRRSVRVSTSPRKATPSDYLDEMYLMMLKSHQSAFKSVFQHIHDHPGEPFLFHCTAGKDRTGVLTALVQSLAGTPVSDIAHDYALTRVGIEPAKDLLKQKAARLLEEFPGHPMINAASSFDPDAMRKFLDGLERRHYGILGWLYTSLGFNALEIVAMKNNLRRDWS